METRLQQEINKVLRGFSEYWEEDTLLKNKLIEDIRFYNGEVIEALLSNELIKNTYSLDLPSGLVFKVEDFINMLRFKNYWDNSYTKYTNEIGLTSENKYFKYNSDAVLDFPHKDSILEGGMTKEEVGKKEIYYHNIIAKEEIDTLLAPKILFPSKRYDNNGQKSAEKFYLDDNLIIKGNNLIALKTIKERYARKVKLIYIDPPYNTGNDGFQYNDQFNHATWLTFMRNRLEVAKDLLLESGALYISIDDNEAAYLKVMMDEIFGRENFLAQIAYERSGVSGLGQGGSFLVNTHESILVYAKNKSQHTTYNDRGLVKLEQKDMKRYNKILTHEGERKEVTRFIAPSTKEEVIVYQHENYEIESISMRDFDKRKEEIQSQYVEQFQNIFRNTSVQKENEFQNKILNLCEEGLYTADYKVSRGKNKNKWITAYYLNQQVFAWLKDTALIKDNNIFKTNKLSQFWTHGAIPKADLANEGGVNLRRGKKPENLLKRIIDIETQEGDIVLDFFAGSGTTCAVSHKMNRKYIGIEQMNYTEETTIERLKNVIKGEQSGVSKQLNWQGGGSFVYAELYRLNEAHLHAIQSCTDNKELEQVINRMKQSAYLNFKVDLEKVTTKNEDFNLLSLDEQKDVLIQALDMNQLYLNYSEIEDSQYDISDSVKAFNHSFYQKEGDMDE